MPGIAPLRRRPRRLAVALSAGLLTITGTAIAPAADAAGAGAVTVVAQHLYNPSGSFRAIGILIR